MASFRKRGKVWRVEIYREGKRESATFQTKQEAAAWAVQREAELSGDRLPEKTVGDALKRYLEEVSPSHGGHVSEKVKLTAWMRSPLAHRRVASVTGADIAEWRDARLSAVQPATVAREMTLLRGVFEECRRHWGWVRENPFRDVRKPRSPPSRKRRISDDEVDRVTTALGLSDLESATSENRTGLAFLFALETAMRSGEILALTWANVHPKHVHLPKTKNGDARDVPLSPRAREILDVLPRDRTTCFDVNPSTRVGAFRVAVKAARVEDLHFHDSRAEAIWRLSKNLDVLELARVIGHRDIRSLMIYYDADAATLADKLG